LGVCEARWTEDDFYSNGLRISEDRERGAPITLAEKTDKTVKKICCGGIKLILVKLKGKPVDVIDVYTNV